MNRQEITAIIEAASQTDHLHRWDVTGAIDNYPTPYLGAFVYGFKTWEQVEAFHATHGGEIGSGYWKHGWHVCHYKGKRKIHTTTL